MGVEVFEGNTADPMTVSSQIEKLRNRFGLERITVVGDRGMLTEASIDREIQEELSDEKVVFAYKRLSSVEQAFRYIKLVDLKLRPVYHRLEDRVRAHVLVCMLAYYVEWEMRKRMAPILFEDEASAIEREKKKKSIVSPAENLVKPWRKHQQNKQTMENSSIVSERR